MSSSKTDRAIEDNHPGINPGGVEEIGAALRRLLADALVLYIKTKNFHWHVSGSHFHDYHRLLDRQAEQIFATTDVIAERARKIGGTTLRSIGHIARLQRVVDNDAGYVTAHDMLAELREDNSNLAARLREAHGLCADRGDIATTGLIEGWIDQAEGRAWFLFETTQNGECD